MGPRKANCLFLPKIGDRPEQERPQSGDQTCRSRPAGLSDLCLSPVSNGAHAPTSRGSILGSMECATTPVGAARVGRRAGLVRFRSRASLIEPVETPRSESRRSSRTSQQSTDSSGSESSSNPIDLSSPFFGGGLGAVKQ